MIKIIKIYSKESIQLIDFEIDGNFNTMPYILFKRKYKPKKHG